MPQRSSLNHAHGCCVQLTIVRGEARSMQLTRRSGRSPRPFVGALRRSGICVVRCDTANGEIIISGRRSQLGVYPQTAPAALL